MASKKKKKTQNTITHLPPQTPTGPHTRSDSLGDSKLNHKNQKNNINPTVTNPTPPTTTHTWSQRFKTQTKKSKDHNSITPHTHMVIRSHRFSERVYENIINTLS